MVFSSSVFASESMEASVTINPSLTLTIPTNTITLNLDPSTTTFNYQDLSISVGTNNPTGYKLTMSSTGNATDLVNTEDDTKTIPTLSSGTYDESTFEVNKWGYKKDNSSFIPFVSGITLLQNDLPTNNDSTTLRFASKIDYNQPAGTYNMVLNFNATSNPLIYYMQDFTAELCEQYASDDDFTVIDKRDNYDYTVRYINGNCWMTQNLRLGYNANNPSTYPTITLSPETSNVSVERSITPYNQVTYGYARGPCYGNGTPANQGAYNNSCMYSSNDQSFGVWYNNPAATAGTVIGATQAEAAEDICPKNWKIPSKNNFDNLVPIINTDPSIFNPTLNGHLTNNSFDSTTTNWLSTTAGNVGGIIGYSGYVLLFYSNNFAVADSVRQDVGNVRCILR